MQVGLRVPSLKKRIAARTSWKRYARQNLGLKAPKGVQREVSMYSGKYHAIAHNKIIIIYRITPLTGSFNFTKADEEKNTENMLILRGNWFT